MDIAATSAAEGPTPAVMQAAGSKTMGKDEFLRLLVTQLSNQDPMNPLDGHDFAAQLAQFSSVEQLIHINEVLDGQADAQSLLAQNINSGVAAGLIGKQVEAEGNRFGYTGDGAVPLRFSTEAAASSVEITIRNEHGSVIRTLQRGGLGAGEHELSWDGTDGENSRLPAGTYTFEVHAADADGGVVAASPWLRGRVDRVSFGGDGIRLWIGDTAVPMGAVRTVYE